MSIAPPCIALILALLAPSAALAAPVYLVTPLGNLGGAFGDVRALNDAGAVVGYALSAGSVNSAYVSRGGAIVSLHPPGAASSVASGINNAGVAAGTVVDGGVSRAVTFSGGAANPVGSLGGANSVGADLNDQGQVTGSAERADGVTRAFRSTPGAGLRDLGSLGGASSAGSAINNAGEVAGRADTMEGSYHAFATQGDTMRDLGTLGGRFSEATGINEGGAVTGFSFLTGDAYAHAFLYQAGAMGDLGTLGGLNSYGYDLNDAGQVVGASEIGGGNALHAFLHAGGVMTDLNALVQLEAGWVLNYAADINELGQIAALGCNQFGQCQGYLLTLDGPVVDVPEPGTLLLMAAGLLALSLRRRRKKPVTRPSAGRD